MIEIQADDLCIQRVVGVPDRPTALRGILHFKLFESSTIQLSGSDGIVICRLLASAAGHDSFELRKTSVRRTRSMLRKLTELAGCRAKLLLDHKLQPVGR